MIVSSMCVNCCILISTEIIIAISISKIFQCERETFPTMAIRKAVDCSENIRKHCVKNNFLNALLIRISSLKGFAACIATVANMNIVPGSDGTASNN